MVSRPCLPASDAQSLVLLDEIRNVDSRWRPSVSKEQNRQPTAATGLLPTLVKRTTLASPSIG